MSEIKYGLISETDARTIERTIDLICDEFKDEIINVTEVGVYSGETGRGISQYLKSNKGRNYWITGIDNRKDNQTVLFPYNEMIYGNSNEVYNQLEDDSQHMIFDDGDHSLIGVISDFYAYADKIKVGGYFCFHDSAKHIKPFQDFQHGDRNNPDAFISVRKALEKLHMFNSIGGKVGDKFEWYKGRPNWKLIFDEADKTNAGGGVTVFRKLF